jgi:secernin
MCDTLCVLDDGRTLFAKSSDRPFGEVQVVEALPRRPAGGTLHTQYLTVLDHGAAAILGGRPTWLWGLEHGVNEHRVAIGNERIWTKDDPSLAPAALTGMDLVRLGLERAVDAEEAVDLITNLIEEHGQGGIGEEATGEAYFSSFLVADPRSAWIIETSGRTWAVKPVDRRARGAAISNRVSLHLDWTGASHDVPPGANFQRWRDLEYPTAHADQRIAAAEAVVRSAAGPADLAALLRHHGGHPWAGGLDDPEGRTPRATIDPIPPPEVHRDGTGVSICMHLRNWEATTGAMIAELHEDPEVTPRAWVALGNPCVSIFVPVFPPDLGAPPLATPATWAAFDRLKRRAEDAADEDPAQGLEVLAAIRDHLGPVERRLWDDADEVAPGGAAEDVAARRAYLASVEGRLASVFDHLARVV